LYKDWNFTGQNGTICGDSNYSTSDYRAWAWPDGTSLNDSVSSIKNTGTVSICFYYNINYNAFMFALPPQQNVNIGYPGNDAISSSRPC
jgi:hypothetical protein